MLNVDRRVALRSATLPLFGIGYLEETELQNAADKLYLGDKTAMKLEDHDIELMKMASTIAKRHYPQLRFNSLIDRNAVIKFGVKLGISL